MSERLDCECELPSDVDALYDCLDGLELTPTLLRRDPEGRDWLPEPWASRVAASAELRAALGEWVDAEVELFDGARGPSDALFTARVMAQLPDEPAVDAARRRRILLVGYLAAAFVAGTLALPEGLFDASGVLMDSWHRWLEALSMGGALLTAALAVSAAALVWPTGDGPGQVARG